MVHKPKDAGQEHLDDLLDAALAGHVPGERSGRPPGGRGEEAATGRRAKGGPSRDEGEKQPH